MFIEGIEIKEMLLDINEIEDEWLFVEKKIEDLDMLNVVEFIWIIKEIGEIGE